MKAEKVTLINIIEDISMESYFLVTHMNTEVAFGVPIRVDLLLTVTKPSWRP
jgi:hypothetical protein